MITKHTTAPKISQKLLIRIFSKVKVSNIHFYKNVPCWDWQGYISKKGYGNFMIKKGINTGSHKITYLLFVGDIPEDLVCDHLCERKNCVNPAHIKITTQQNNILRGSAKSVGFANATHCVNGHQFSGNNLNVRFDKVRNKLQRRRECRQCKRDRQIAYIARKKSIHK